MVFQKFIGEARGGREKTEKLKTNVLGIIHIGRSLGDENTI